MEKLTRQQLVDIIMIDDEDNETQLEFLQTLTRDELEELVTNADATVDEL